MCTSISGELPRAWRRSPSLDAMAAAYSQLCMMNLDDRETVQQSSGWSDPALPADRQHMPKGNSKRGALSSCQAKPDCPLVNRTQQTNIFVASASDFLQAQRMATLVGFSRDRLVDGVNSHLGQKNSLELDACCNWWWSHQLVIVYGSRPGLWCMQEIGSGDS